MSLILFFVGAIFAFIIACFIVQIIFEFWYVFAFAACILPIAFLLYFEKEVVSWNKGAPIKTLAPQVVHQLTSVKLPYISNAPEKAACNKN